MIKTRKISMVLLMALILSFAMIGFSPVAYAGGTDIFDEFNVNLDNEGNLNVTTQDDTKTAWQTLIEKYQNFITGIAAIGAVTMVVLFIIQFLKLGASAGNPSARSQALTGVLWTGFAAAGLGAVALITGIFYRAIN